jgi:hypothetical protein
MHSMCQTPCLAGFGMTYRQANGGSHLALLQSLLEYPHIEISQCVASIFASAGRCGGEVGGPPLAGGHGFSVPRELSVLSIMVLSGGTTRLANTTKSPTTSSTIQLANDVRRRPRPWRDLSRVCGCQSKPNASFAMVGLRPRVNSRSAETVSPGSMKAWSENTSKARGSPWLSRSSPCSSGCQFKVSGGGGCS